MSSYPTVPYVYKSPMLRWYCCSKQRNQSPRADITTISFLDETSSLEGTRSFFSLFYIVQKEFLFDSIFDETRSMTIRLSSKNASIFRMKPRSNRTMRLLYKAKNDPSSFQHTLPQTPNLLNTNTNNLKINHHPPNQKRCAKKCSSTTPMGTPIA